VKRMLALVLVTGVLSAGPAAASDPLTELILLPVRIAILPLKIVGALFSAPKEPQGEQVGAVNPSAEFYSGNPHGTRTGDTSGNALAALLFLQQQQANQAADIRASTLPSTNGAADYLYQQQILGELRGIRNDIRTQRLIEGIAP
jgi:hypothetical protein